MITVKTMVHNRNETAMVITLLITVDSIKKIITSTTITIVMTIIAPEEDSTHTHTKIMNRIIVIATMIVTILMVTIERIVTMILILSYIYTVDTRLRAVEFRRGLQIANKPR